jgi:signal transduction histidine kinase
MIAQKTLASVLEQFEAAIVGVNSNYEVVLCNSAAQTLLGVEATALINKDWCDLFLPKSFEGECQKQFALTHKEMTLPFPINSEDHRLFMWRNNFVNLQENETLMLSIGVDVTQDSVEKSEMQRMLYAQSKLAVMGEMMGMILHQYKQPLQNIYMLSQFLEESADEGRVSVKEVKEFTKNLNEQVLYLSKTIDDFKNFFSPKTNMHTFSVRKMVLEIERLLKLPFAKQNVILEIDDLEVSLYGASEELKQVLLNLLNNAKDAINSTHESGSREGVVRLSLEKKKSDLIITVCDTGGGIPKEVLPNIFNHSFTTKGDAGSGLGLYISRMILEEHFDATISVKNSEKGACFSMSLPMPIQSNEVF